GLADLANLDLLNLGLARLKQRLASAEADVPTGSPTIRIAVQALRSILERNVKTDATIIKALAGYARQLGQRPDGENERTRTRLAPLVDPKVLTRLLQHPLKEMRLLADKPDLTYREAVRFGTLL